MQISTNIAIIILFFIFYFFYGFIALFFLPGFVFLFMFYGLPLSALQKCSFVLPAVHLHIRPSSNFSRYH